MIEAVSGYAGGDAADATYEAVSSGRTEHLEAVEVVYDPQVVSYEYLVEYYFRRIDPTDGGGQFVDRGPQYRTAVFYANEEERAIAETVRDRIAAHFAAPVVTEIRPRTTFFPAEAYHQGYCRTHPDRYRIYRRGSGRDEFLHSTWEGKPMTTPKPYRVPSDEEVRARLTPLAYEVTRRGGTEPPFRNAYWDNKRAGIYVDVVSGEPLFSSKEKYDSGTGWPSFWKPLVPENVVEREDRSLGMVRTEVRSRHGDSHLGHLFDDGPPPTGLRYCINSAALRFIPVEDLEKEGYGEFLPHFEG